MRRVLPAILSDSVSDGVWDESKANPALDLCIRHGINEGLVSYAASLTPEDQASSNTLYRMASRYGTHTMC
ncbi:hypothetical protein KIPB_001750 [Kipferlia bialata]|uniref:Uncharacterized protein n=1 Tax=Kipferlia bialata TaxID=797122 RepID=A0A9K3GFH8_9EUKA|nr:hypothetical protein KIPB_001750 [Kipferlia bialata]|eukprot:g1750.t1